MLFYFPEWRLLSFWWVGRSFPDSFLALFPALPFRAWVHDFRGAPRLTVKPAGRTKERLDQAYALFQVFLFLSCPTSTKGGHDA